MGIFREEQSLTYIEDVFTIYAMGQILYRETVPEEYAADYLSRHFGIQLEGGNP